MSHYTELVVEDLLEGSGAVVKKGGRSLRLIIEAFLSMVANLTHRTNTAPPFKQS